MKKDLLITIIVILSILAVIAGFIGLCFWLFGGKLSTTGLNLSSSEITFLTSNGFLESENANINSSYLKPSNLIEQNLNSDNESFKVLATKLSNNKYQMAFKLENKSEQDKDFYLIPVSKDSQLQFEEVRGIIDDKNTIAFNKENTSKEPLEQLYDVEKHKKELNPELAKAYEDIKGNGYSAKPIKITLPPKSTLLAYSDWKVVGRSDPQNWRVGPSNGSAGSAVGLKPVYFLIYGSAGGAKDDLVIINVQSHPQQGENWEVSFTTNGKADLKIIPNDKATIDDDEFISLSCNNERRDPQILKGDVIFYPNWECFGTGKVVHYTKKAGKHILRFEFNNQTALAYNTAWLSGWSYRKKITIDNAYVDANLTDFPVYVKINADVQIGDGAQIDGDDIRFTFSDGTTLLKYQEESWSGGAGTDATANYWVKVPTVATALDTDIYIYYGNGTATDAQDPTNVWDSNFMGVWHLAETVTDEGVVSGLYQDSTINNRDGTQAGPDDIAGKVYNGQDFDGTNDYISAGDIAAIDTATALTSCAWVYHDTITTEDHYIFSKNDSPNAGILFFRDDVAFTSGRTDTYTVVFYDSADAEEARIESATNASPVTTWTYVCATFTTNSATGLRLYVNGVEDANSPVSSSTIGAINAGTQSFRIGIRDTTLSPFNGIIDEARVSSVVRSAEWIKFEYRNMNEADNEISLASQETVSFFNQGWLYRKKIIIDHNNVDGDLTDFPLYVYLNPSGAGIGLGSKIRDDGYDVRFTSADGVTTLKYERESYSEASGNSTGNFWVKVPTVAGASNTAIYMYYGKSDAADGQDAVNTWNTNFTAVWHLKETATDEGTAASLYQDSTVNNNDGTQAGPDDIAGKVYNGQDFDGTNDNVNVGDEPKLDFSSTTSVFSVSLWAKADDFGNNAGLVAKYDGDSSNQRGWNFNLRNDGKLAWLLSEDGTYSTTTAVFFKADAAITAGVWTHLAGTVDVSTDTFKLYVNGLETAATNQNTKTTITDIFSNSASVYIGKDTGTLSTTVFDGILDEVRISSIVHPAEWIKFEYYNMSEADNELRWEDEYPTPNPLNITGGFNVKGGFEVKSQTASWLSGWNYRKKITIDNAYVDTNLTDFPVYVKISADVQIGGGAQNDGDDIRFTSSNGTTLLKYQEESWSGGAGTDATANYWVKVPTVATAADTDIYIYYGNASAPDAQDPTNVWDSNFTGVWHLAETATDEGTVASLYQDSTTNNKDGTQAGPDDIAGKVYNGQDFDGTNDYVETSWTGRAAGTVSFWVNTTTELTAPISFGNSGTSYGLWQVVLGQNATSSWTDELITVSAADAAGSAAPLFVTSYRNATRTELLNGAWHNITIVSGGATYPDIYLDGAFKTTSDTTDHGTPVYSMGAENGNIFRIGERRYNGANSLPFNGQIDDVRTSSSARSAEWIKFEYRNINEADNELGWGAQE